jgi:hypothetical protein
MSSLSAKDRVSLCSFTFSDGRRCRTPRIGNNPRFCPYHAEKEARARAAETLGKDLDYFFSGDYLSACDLSTALARLIPAVVRGDVKSKTARTVAYLAQTLMQSIHLSKHEYINAFGTDAWRDAVRNSVNGNQDYRFPPAPKPAQSGQPQPQPAPPQTPAPQSAETPVNCHSERSEEPAFSPSPAPPLNRPQSAAVHPIPAPQPAPSPHTPLPPTGAEFVQRVLARLQTGAGQAPQPAQAPSSNPPQPTEPPVNCHSERTEESASSSNSSLATQHSPLPQTPPPPQPTNPPQTAPSTPQPALNRDPYAIHFDHNCRLRIDGKPF